MAQGQKVAGALNGTGVAMHQFIVFDDAVISTLQSGAMVKNS
ncbi:hypothetical protein O9992_20765 [Vibrio lentus]|nr:hypothetical protein [Vibrio lentus]